MFFMTRPTDFHLINDAALYLTTGLILVCLVTVFFFLLSYSHASVSGIGCPFNFHSRGYRVLRSVGKQKVCIHVLSL